MAESRYGAETEGPQRSVAGGLPRTHTPIIAQYAPGPFIRGEVTPSEIRWMNARTYVVETSDGVEWRALRVLDEHGELLGYWGIEQLGVAFDFGLGFDADRQASIEEVEQARDRQAREARRRKLGRRNE